MRLPHAALALLLSASLAGCSFGRGEGESSGIDKEGYDGGIGIALAVANSADKPFDVTVRVLGVGNAELARFEERLEPGDSVEKWYSLQSQGIYSARLAYQFQGEGRAASGDDDRPVDTSQCPELSRISWELREAEGQVGSAFLGKTCVGESTDETA